MPQKQERRSEMWWRGHNDALAGDPPNESYYHYYYDYKLAYDQTRREQRRTHRQQILSAGLRSAGGLGLIVLLLMAMIAGGWYWLAGRSTDPLLADAATPTVTPRPTPRPTLTPSVPTPTPEPILRADGFAVVTGTAGAPLRIRAEPGTNAPLVTRINEGQNVRILEGPAMADQYEWWRVEADGQSGWAAAPYLQPIDPPSAP